MHTKIFAPLKFNLISGQVWF